MKRLLIYLFVSIQTIIYCPAQLYDNTFNGNGVWNAQIRNQTNNLKAIAVQSDGKIVFAGSTANTGGSEVSQFMLGRLTTGGIIDNTFNTDGIAEFAFSTDNFNSADNVIFFNNKIYACGFNNNGGVFEDLLVKIDLNGDLDNTLNGTGKLAQTIAGHNTNVPYSLNATSDNKIIVIGYSYTSQYNLSGFKTDESGVLDNTFGTNGKIFFNTFGEPIQNSCIQTDNKILVIVNGILLRIKTNGNLDSTSFGTDGQVSLGSNSFKDIAIQKDGKIILCGKDANDDFVVYRYNQNGTLDNLFGTNGKVIVPFSGTTNCANAIAIDTTSITGKIFVTGYSYYGGTNSYFALTRISSIDGTVEAQAEFKPNDLEGEAKDILLQSDGKIIVGGSTSASTTDDLIIARINSNFSSIIAGISEVNITSIGINLFPNPASHSINVHSIYNIENIKVVNLIGNEVLNVNSNGNTQLDISTLPKGLYNFIITTDRGTGTKKISIQ